MLVVVVCVAARRSRRTNITKITQKAKKRDRLYPGLWCSDGWIRLSKQPAVCYNFCGMLCYVWTIKRRRRDGGAPGPGPCSSRPCYSGWAVGSLGGTASLSAAARFLGLG